MHDIMARLDQLLITIRSLTILCDHMRLMKTGLIAIMQLIAKLVDNLNLSAQPRWTV